MNKSLDFHLQNSTYAIFHSNDSRYQDLSLNMLYEELNAASLNDVIEDCDDTETPYGTCISPWDAANCLLDTARTVKFVRGLAAAIRKKRKKQSGKKVSILYAGCGPFATLALPVTALFNPNQIGFTVLDIHEASIKNAQRIVEIMNISAYFDDFVCQNALDYPSANQDKKFDIIITETMTAGLLNEPQAAITTALSDMLEPDGIFVPEQIIIGVKLKAEKILNQPAIPLGTIFLLTKDTKPDKYIPLLKANTKTPPTAEDGLEYGIMLTTQIKIFGPHILQEGESAITMHVPIKKTYKKEDGSQIRIAYPLGGGINEVRVKAF